MAGLSFPHRGSSVHNTSGTDDWSKASYASDHVCRPVIIDADGRKRPIASYGQYQNSDFYVTRTETIVEERVLSPFVSEHKYTPYKSPDSLERYEVVEDRWQRPSSPVHGRPQKVDEFLTKVQTEASKPRFGPFNPTNWRQNTEPTGFPHKTGGYGSEYNDFDNHDWQKPGSNAYRNDNYDEFPSKQGNTTNGGWGPPNHTIRDGASPNSIYLRPTNDCGGAKEYLKEPVKPSHTTVPPFRHTEPAYKVTTGSRESIPVEPTMIIDGGWVRPSRSMWASPPDSNLSKPISDINTATEVLKEAAKPSFSPTPNTRYTEPQFTETIDSNEAARRYKINAPSRAYTNEDNYTKTIDSKEAARKYHGTMI